ncbi:MAG: Uma2 family endonuclease [Phycisphaeraceae bacterium]
MRLPEPRTPSEIRVGDPTWDIAYLYPEQGDWSADDYLAMSARSNRHIELSKGCLILFPTETLTHQRILGFLISRMGHDAGIARRGEVLAGGYPVRLDEVTIRMCDILFMFDEHADRMLEEYCTQPDLIVEIIGDDRDHVKETKRDEYAKAGIGEYWIIDPRDRVIHVLTLRGTTYVPHGEFRDQTPATSLLLEGFEVVPDAVWAAGEGRR